MTQELVSGLANTIENIQASINRVIWQNDLPFFGDQLASQEQAELLAKIANKIRNITVDNSEPIENLIEKAIERVTGTDATVKPILETSETDFALTIIGNVESSPIPIVTNVGLPALGFELNTTAQTSAHYTVSFNFGVDQNDSFFINSLPGEELVIDLRGSLVRPADQTQPDAQAKLGFLQLQATNREATINPKIKVDISGTNSQIALQSVSLDGNFNLDLGLQTGFNQLDSLPPDAFVTLPSISSDLKLNWYLGGTSIDVPTRKIKLDSGQKPTINFENIEFNLGQFLSEFILPPLRGIQYVTRPLEPFTRALTADITTLRDLGVAPLFDADQDGKATLLDLMQSLAGDTIDVRLLGNIARFNNLLNDYLNFLDVRETEEPQELKIKLGNFSLGHEDIRNEGLDLATIDPQESEERQTLDQVLNDPNNPQEGFGRFIRDFKTIPGGGINFPVLDDLTSIFNLFIGKPFDLITYDAPALVGGFYFERFFPVTGPIGVTLRGEVKAAADFAFGFDTDGLERSRSTGNPLDVLNGFYVSDPTRIEDGQQRELPEAMLDANIAAFGALEGGIARGGVGGGIYANMLLDIVDRTPDGKVRGSDIYPLLFTNPLALFDVSGEFTAGLETYAEIGWPDQGLGQRWTWNSPRTTLGRFDTSFMPEERSPILATDLGSGTLQLNMGSNAGQRSRLDTKDGYESFKVEGRSNARLDIDASNEQLLASFAADVLLASENEILNVSALGFSQEYVGFGRIIADGGQGDSILELINITASLSFNGGGGNDFVQGSLGNDELSGGNGWDRLLGGDGDDSLSGGVDDDMLYAGGGDDTLNGGDDDDILFGDQGNDSLAGGNGSDNLNGNDGIDRIRGEGGEDLLDGGNDSDILEGGDQADRLYGQGGGDTLSGGTDNDFLDGGDDNDVLNGDAGDDQLIGATGEDELIGGDGSDIVSGGDGNDRLQGDAGNDFLDGGNGDDNLAGSEGDDEITGAAGNDTLAGDAGTDLLDGGDGDDAISGGDGDDVALGGAGNDAIAGDAGNDYIEGGKGNDTLNGGAGDDVLNGNEDNDILNGGDGDDELNGGDGDDILEGGAGSDFIDGGTGSNTLSYENETAGVIVNTDTKTYLNHPSADCCDSDCCDLATDLEPDFEIGAKEARDGSGSLDTVVNITTIVASNYADVLIGNCKDNQFQGRGGDDVLIGNDGDDVLDGEAGNDTASYRRDPASIRANLETGRVQDGFGESDRLVSIENIIGSRFSDQIIGNDQDNSLLAEAGNDSVDGQDGNDRLEGGRGNDTLEGGRGDDALFGQQGRDRLEGGKGNDQLNGGCDDDWLYGQEGDDILAGGDDKDYLDGGVGNDQLDGGCDDDDLYGRDDNDTLRGGEGNDYLDGGTEADQLFGDVGNDQLYGQDGNDTLGGGIGNDSAIGGSGQDLLQGNEGDDILKGESEDDILNGGIGNDQLDGGSENDTLDGGDGDDILNAGDGDDILVGGEGGDRLSGGTGQDVLTGGAGDDEIYTGSGNDQALGGAGQDSIYGENGNDTLHGEAGNDFLNSGAGDDMISGGAGADELWGDIGLDTLDGGVGNDTLNGGAGNDTLTGGIGDDNLLGGSGTDQLDGGVGNDTLLGDDGDDSLLGGIGVDALFGGKGDDILNGETGDDTLWGGDDYDLLLGQAGDDHLNGDAGNDQLDGGDGEDILLGGSGNDILIGGIGNDTLSGGSGNDNLEGGIGSDRFLYTSTDIFKSTNIGFDQIVDFQLGIDKIMLDKTMFKDLKSIAGNGFSVASEFAMITSDNAAATSKALIVYNASNGKLFYNQNGAKTGLGAGAAFAALTGTPNLTADNFAIQM